MKTIVLSLLSLLLFPCIAVAQGDGEGGIESRVRLRNVDRATVRILALGGIHPVAFDGRRTRLARVAAVGDASHGSGVA
ncbi:MAG: hypothetical protein H5U40_05155, partial [Polyangiaceae bacterium]|nr:hypothetical protein [Polyangiaceae bacterium]